MLKKIALIAYLITTISQLSWADTFKIDTPHSQINFSISHMVMFTVRGVFSDFSGTVEADVKSKSIQSIESSIMVESISTRDSERDEHLKSNDFFAAKQHPVIKFKSKKIIGSGNNITVIGDLTIRGITKSITLTGRYLGEMTDPWGNTRVGFLGHGKLKRYDYQVKWNKILETGGVMVGKDVQITLEIQLLKVK